MKIAIASDDGQVVAAHTGRCNGFVVFEVEGPTATRIEHRANVFTAHARGECHGTHEAGVAQHSHAPLLDAIADCRVLVTRGLGPRLVADFAARGIEAYLCTTERVDEAAEQYAQGRLARASGKGCCCHG